MRRALLFAVFLICACDSAPIQDKARPTVWLEGETTFEVGTQQSDSGCPVDVKATTQHERKALAAPLNGAMLVRVTPGRTVTINAPLYTLTRDVPFSMVVAEEEGKTKLKAICGLNLPPAPTGD